MNKELYNLLRAILWENANGEEYADWLIELCDEAKSLGIDREHTYKPLLDAMRQAAEQPVI